MFVQFSALFYKLEVTEERSTAYILGFINITIKSCYVNTKCYHYTIQNLKYIYL